jgi:hypothetical protein
LDVTSGSGSLLSTKFNSAEDSPVASSFFFEDIEDKQHIKFTASGKYVLFFGAFHGVLEISKLIRIPEFYLPKSI